MVKQINSKSLAVLEKLDIPYIIKGREAYLKDYDSLKISLDPKKLDSWKRYSTGDHGRSSRDLVTYLLRVGIISRNEALSILGELSPSENNKVKGIPSVSITVEEAKPFNPKNQVKDPRAWNLKRYLSEKRMINPIVIEALLNKGSIIEDGRGSIRFLWYDQNGNNTGAEVVSTGEEKLRYIISGSSGLFYQTTKDINNLQSANRIVLFEAPIDLISYLELVGYKFSDIGISENKPKTAFISLSGSVTKIERTIKKLEEDWKIDLKSKEIVVATDADSAGDKTFEIIKKLYPSALRERVVSRSVPLKDWNDLLCSIKGGEY